jgi:Lysyl oxidase
VKVRHRVASAVLLALAAVPVASVSGAPGGVGGSATNPCVGPGSAHLLCPDLRVGPATDLYVEQRGGGYYRGSTYYAAGRGTLLHASNDIRSRGRGPMELRGRKYKRHWMRANQAIYRAGGGVKVFRTEMRLHFFDVGYEWGGSYWKVHNPLSMEIWSLDDRRRPEHRVRKGPKVFYCFRDLERTKPMRRSPHHPVYGACSQDPGRKRLRLGTSVGWSDIYPSDYDRQWVSVGGLRGCYAFVMRVDPLNLLYESNERNNRSVRIVRLPYHDGPQHC